MTLESNQAWVAPAELQSDPKNHKLFNNNTLCESCCVKCAVKSAVNWPAGGPLGFKSAGEKYDMQSTKTTPDRPPWHHCLGAVSAELLGTIIWAGRQWACTSYGLERLDGGHAISERNLGLDWIAHMAARPACDLPDFIAGLAVARMFHGGRDKESAGIFANICTRESLNGYARQKGRPGTM